MALNDKTLRDTITRAQLLGGDKPIRLYDGRGLYLQVSPKEGVARWNFKYRFDGKYRRVTLGVWSAVTATEARSKAQRIRADITEGKPPHLKVCATAGNTFADLADEYYRTNEPRWKPRHALCVERYLNRARDAFGKKPMAGIAAPDVLRLVRGIEAEEKHETASRVRLYVEKVFDYAQAIGAHTGTNPATPIGSRGVMAPKPRVIHHAAMTFDQIKPWLERLDASPRAFIVKAALKFTLLTAMRTGEVRALQWKHIDGKKLTMPAELMKGKREHVVLLSPQARQILDALELLYTCKPDDYVFPGRGVTDEPLSDMAMLSALKDTMPEDVEATVHGFRSTFSTWANENHMAHEAVVERCLAHANGDKVAAAYNRASFEADAARLWKRWADAIMPR